jgi:cell division protein FtsW (lipid II flippase)
MLIYSSSLPTYPEGLSPGHPVVKQSAFALLGFGVMIAVAWVDYRTFGQAAVGLYVVALGILGLVLVIGDPVYGSTRWFTIAGQQVQASEIAKLLTIIVLARFSPTGRNTDPDVRVPDPLAIAVPPALLVMIEPDMGTRLFGARCGEWCSCRDAAEIRRRVVGSVVALIRLRPFGMGRSAGPIATG